MTNASYTPPRKKRSVMWWVGGVFVLLAFLFFFQLFGPNPRIIVSPQTTYITKPLGPDGLPDYERYLLDLYREGVTPENNAGVLLLKALWPGELDPSQHAAVVTELGLEQIPSRDEALVRLHDEVNRQRVAVWVGEQVASQDKSAPANDTARDAAGIWIDPSELESDSAAVEEILDQAMSRPWTGALVPPLAKWVVENKGPLDLIVAASRRPRYYVPSPSLINNRRDLLVAMLLPHVQSTRDAARGLSARAMWHIGEGRPMEAWQDLAALHRLARLVGQGRTLVEQLVGFAISGIACDGTQTLLAHGGLDADQARRVMHDLEALEYLAAIADSLDQTERMLFLDIVTRLSRGDSDELKSAAGIGEGLSYLMFVSVDWNMVLRKGNQYYDRYVAAARLATRSAREQAFAKIDADVMRLQGEFGTPAMLISAAMSPAGRGDAVASIMLGLFLPALSAATNAEDRTNTQLELARLAAALAVYRAEHGEYPQQLGDLVPGVLQAAGLDLYNAKPYLYQRTGDGYLLYSAGANGADEGGSNEQMSTLEGRPLEGLNESESEVLRTKIPAGADDISVRLPRPAFKLPPVAPSAAAKPE
jgi:hypothetical protein